MEFDRRQKFSLKLSELKLSSHIIGRCSASLGKENIKCHCVFIRLSCKGLYHVRMTAGYIVGGLIYI